MKAESIVNLAEVGLKMFTWDTPPPCLGKDSIKHFL